MDEIDEIIKNRVVNRLSAMIPFLREFGINEFYIGGNSLNRGKPRDYDLFPVKKNDFDKSGMGKYTIISTKNARTIRYLDMVIQMCNYHHESLAALIESFDFAHIKVGAHVVCDEIGIEAGEIYYSQDWLIAKSVESTRYTGSEYPLSSLIRCLKYHGRGDYSGVSYMGDVIEILTDIIRRGFVDYDDFKDQLDAVDLGLVPEDYSEIGMTSLMDLFNLLKKR